MSAKKKVVVLISKGMDDERASVAWSIANGGIKSGLEVSIFLVSSGVDWVRKGAYSFAHLNPKDPTMKDMIETVLANKCRIMVCPPCSAVRGYTVDDLIDGIELVGSTALHQLILEGAETISI
ncbi:DsrE family protein [Zhouia amylolytica]|uniref:DsrE family protein n=1 Tax=Zhouia amylolytica AD3 TaxID=1286632 RepID=W2URZ9_9FLAO|nr:DsrE family protein [Zhouia amylolytica]ETN96945.1 DsrE family protein [Zhouia amylolytica AD3]